MLRFFVCLIAVSFGYPTQCPQLWTAEWAKGMAQVFEHFIFKEVVTDPNAWNLHGQEQGSNYYKSKNSKDFSSEFINS